MNFVNIVSLATRRGVRTKAVVITMALVCTLFSGLALAGQGPSQWCSDGWNSSEIHLINDPVTFNLEPGTSFGNPNYFMTCFSTTPYGSGDSEVTGGAVSVDTPTQAGTGVSCWSDGAAMVRLDCYNGVGLNTSNPTSPTASASAGGQLTVLGVPVGVGPYSTGPIGITGTCANSWIAVSATDCANGEFLAISGTGNSTSAGYNVGGVIAPSIAVSGTGCATAPQWDGSVAASTGYNGCPSTGSIAVSAFSDTGANLIGISGTGTSYVSNIAAISATGDAVPAAASPYLTISGTGRSDARYLAISGTGNSTSWGYGAVPGAIAISGTGTASTPGSGSNPGVAISGANDAYGRDVSISGGGYADAVIVAIGGEDANRDAIVTSNFLDPTSKQGIIDNAAATYGKTAEPFIGYYSAAVMAVREQLGIPDAVDDITDQQSRAIDEAANQLLLDWLEANTSGTIGTVNGVIDPIEQAVVCTATSLSPCIGARAQSSESSQYDRLNGQEKAVCRRHPNNCYKARDTEPDATAWSEKKYSGRGAHNGVQDAFRHCIWSALMTERVTSDFAKEFGEAHEYGDNKQPAKEGAMDIHNNNYGRQAGLDAKQVNPHRSDAWMATACKNYAQGGSLWKISGNNIVATP